MLLEGADGFPRGIMADSVRRGGTRRQFSTLDGLLARGGLVERREGIGSAGFEAAFAAADKKGVRAEPVGRLG